MNSDREDDCFLRLKCKQTLPAEIKSNQSQWTMKVDYMHFKRVSAKETATLFSSADQTDNGDKKVCTPPSDEKNKVLKHSYTRKSMHPNHGLGDLLLCGFTKHLIQSPIALISSIINKICIINIIV